MGPFWQLLNMLDSFNHIWEISRNFQDCYISTGFVMFYRWTEESGPIQRYATGEAWILQLV